MVKAICRELELQKDYLLGEKISSIYFGGGTPSLLSEEELILIQKTISENFKIAEDAEVTLEANPDDLSKKKLADFRKSGINRLSIGIQTFNQELLTFLNRAHNAEQAKNCVGLANDAGFENISIDLIYAIPSPDHSLWEKDLDSALRLKPQHISSYCLTIEPATVFGNRSKKGKMPAIDEEYAASQFEILMDNLGRNGYEQYEISNFCLPGKISRHNSNYWRQEKYLGVGPGAHSYDRTARQQNIAKNAVYISSLAKNTIPSEVEMLNKAAKVNEYIMTSLRTKWGCNLLFLHQEYGIDLQKVFKDYFYKLLKADLVMLRDDCLFLTNSGKLIADKIIEDLFMEH